MAALILMRNMPRPILARALQKAAIQYRRGNFRLTVSAGRPDDQNSWRYTVKRRVDVGGGNR